MFANHADIRQTTVSATTEMLLVSGPAPLRVTAELFYTAHDVYAVHVALSVDESPAVEWVFARDLLRDGMVEPTGDGDIHVYPEFGNVLIDLHSPYGSALLTASTTDLRAFVRNMYAVVPAGTESDWLHIDDTVESLVESEDQLSHDLDR